MKDRQIYVLLDYDGLPKYVGCSVDPKTRVRLHFSSRFKKQTIVARWLQTLDEPPEFKIIQTVPFNRGFRAEELWTIALRSNPSIKLLNVHNGTKHHGYSASPETRVKISKSLKGQNHGNYAIGEHQGSAKLTVEDVLKIKADPRTQRVIAAEYGVSQPTIHGIKTEKSWKHTTR